MVRQHHNFTEKLYKEKQSMKALLKNRRAKKFFNKKPQGKMDDNDPDKLFERLLQESRPSCMRWLMNTGASVCQAEEATSKALEALVRRIQAEGFRKTENYEGLFFDISKKRLIDDFRFQSKHCSLEEGKIEAMEYLNSSFTIPRADRSAIKSLEKLYKQFDTKYGPMIFDKYILLYSDSDIASRLGMTEGSVAATISGQMKKFARWINECPRRSERFVTLVREVEKIEGWRWEWRTK